MTKDEIMAELAAIAEARAMSNNPTQESSPAQTPAMSREKIQAELAEIAAAKKMQSEGGFLHRVGQLGRGIFQGTGAGVDFIQPKDPSLRATSVDPEQVGGIEHFFPQESAEMSNNDPTNQLEKELPRLAGLDEKYEPGEKDTFGKVLNLGGNILAPSSLIPGGGYAHVGKKFLEEGIKSGAKALGKEALMAGAAATAIKATPKIAQEGTIGGAIEDFAKGIFGARSADKIVQKNILKTIARAPKNAFMGAATAMAKPNKRVFDLANHHEVELPFNVGMRSRPMNFTANNYLKSMFTSGVYEDALKNSNESMVSAVKRNIDELGPSNLKPSEASGEYRRFLELEETAAEEATSQLYKNAEKLLKKGDSVTPQSTSSFIGELEELLTRDVQSPATQGVAGIVKQLARSWGISPARMTMKKAQINPKYMEAYLKEFKRMLPNISVEKLIGVRSELGTITKFDSSLKGSKNILNGLKSAIDQDIERVSNKGFLSAWRKANESFKTNVADRFRGDIARSLLANQMPTEAYNLLNTPQNVRELERISGTSPKSKEIFNALKKAKVREIFSSSLQDESLKVSPFINVFNKKEKNAELLETLIGKPQFNKLSEIAEIAEEFKHAGQELLNTSGTAIASSDISKAEKLVKGTLGSIFNSGAGYAVGGAGGAAVGIAMPNLISRLVANPKFVDAARAYALNRQKNNQRHADTILKRLIGLTDTEQRLMMTEARSVDEKKE